MSLLVWWARRMLSLEIWKEFTNFIKGKRMCWFSMCISVISPWYTWLFHTVSSLQRVSQCFGEVWNSSRGCGRMLCWKSRIGFLMWLSPDKNNVNTVYACDFNRRLLTSLLERLEFYWFCVFFVYQAEEFKMYVFYCKNKTLSNNLLIEHGGTFFSVSLWIKWIYEVLTRDCRYLSETTKFQVKNVWCCFARISKRPTIMVCP